MHSSSAIPADSLASGLASGQVAPEALDQLRQVMASYAAACGPVPHEA